MVGISCRNISFSYGKSKSVIDNLSFELEPTDSIGLVGLNGSGKTTLLKLILGLLTPNSGEIFINYKKVKGINFTSKFANIIPENSKLFLIGPTVLDDFTKIVSDSSKAFELLKKHNLDHLAEKKIYHLSEGQRRLIAIFHALHQDKEIFILDEPTIGLDQEGILLIFHLIRKLILNKKIIIVATNDVRILPYFSRIIGIKEGKIVLDGPPSEILFNLKEKMQISPNQVTKVVNELKMVIDIPNIITHTELNNFIKNI